MTLAGWLSIALVLGAVTAFAWPLGLYMARVYEGKPTFASGLIAPMEKAILRLAGSAALRPQSWFAYTLAMLAFNGFGFLLLYAMLRFQHVLPLNPQGFGPVAPDLAFNTAISFVTNTNWQGLRW